MALSALDVVVIVVYLGTVVAVGIGVHWCTPKAAGGSSAESDGDGGAADDRRRSGSRSDGGHAASSEPKERAALNDYFLGGGTLPWWALACSGMASNLDISGTSHVFPAVGVGSL